MLRAYKIIAHIIAALVVLQAAYIAWSTFTVIGILTSGQTVTEENLPLGAILHQMSGMYAIPLLALVLLVIALIAKAGVKWAAYLLLAVIVQVTLAFISFEVPVVGLLHGILPFAILALAEIGARSVGKEALVGRPARKVRA